MGVEIHGVRSSGAMTIFDSLEQAKALPGMFGGTQSTRKAAEPEPRRLSLCRCEPAKPGGTYRTQRCSHQRQGAGRRRGRELPGGRLHKKRCLADWLVETGGWAKKRVLGRGAKKPLELSRESSERFRQGPLRCIL